MSVFTRRPYGRLAVVLNTLSSINVEIIIIITITKKMYGMTQLDLKIVRVPAIRKMVIGGQGVAKILFIPFGRGPHWKLENQCLVNFKSCKSVAINGCIMQHMTS